MSFEEDIEQVVNELIEQRKAGFQAFGTKTLTKEDRDRIGGEIDGLNMAIIRINNARAKNGLAKNGLITVYSKYRVKA